MRKFYIFIIILFASINLSAQTQILEEEVDTTKGDYLKTSSFGQNSKFYIHQYLTAGFLFRNGGDVPEKNIGSNYLEYGIRAKFKLTKVSSFLADLRYAQDYGEIDNLLDEYKWSRYSFQYLELALGHRLNFNPKRGNIIGSYLDIGVYGGWVLGNYTRVKYQNTLNNTNVITKENGHDLTSGFTYGLEARLGFNRLAISFQYRLSDLESSNKVNLLSPRLIATHYKKINPMPIRIGLELRL